jgi:hypothetical protein
VRTLNVLISHLDPAAVDEHLALQRGVAPASRFAVVYTGDAPAFARIRDAEKALVADASLSGPPRSFQAYGEILGAVHEHWLRRAPELDSVYLFEYDHLILSAAFERDLRALAERSSAGLMGKNCVERTATNWHHYARFRRDPALLAFLRRTSVRENPTRLFGTLGNGMWLSRRAIDSYLAVTGHPRCYGELYVPTLLHHLGHRVVDIDSISPLYATVRWEPAFSGPEVDRLCREGARFVHPVKDAAVRRRALAAASRPRRDDELGVPPARELSERVDGNAQELEAGP